MARSTIDYEKQYVAQNYAPLPVVIAKSKGCHVWDENGQQYLDFLSGYSAVSFGHNHPVIVEAVQQQLGVLDVTSRAFYTDNLAPFAEKLCKFAGLPKMLPMNTGAEAVETAIKAARRWGYQHKQIPEGKAEILVSANNFHGRTSTIVSFSSDADYKAGFSPFDGGFKEVPFGDIDALRDAITPNTCAFLTEPMQGEGGINIPPKGWFKQVQELCAEKNILLLVDEIQTGLSRTGKDFAFQHELDTPPDGLMLGKALGGGVYPVSAFLANEEVMNVFDAGSHGSTFGGNPIACAIGMAALELIQTENLTQKSAELGTWFKQELENLQSPLIKDVRGAGLWIGVEISENSPVSAHDLCLELMEQGILAKDTHGTVIRFAPPLVIEKSELVHALDMFTQILQKHA